MADDEPENTAGRFRSIRSAQFNALYDKLSAKQKKAADKAYERWRLDPNYPSLHFKRLRSALWSARFSNSERVVGIVDGDTITWVWIGLHDEYERIIKGL